MKQPSHTSNQRRRIHITGAVQGVGFRPFIYRLALEERLCGWVSNTARGVFIEVEGPAEPLTHFMERIKAEKPPHSIIQSIQSEEIPPAGDQHFEIRISEEGGDKTAFVLPDIATCEECLKELFDPANRRYLYPFINCTHCGPRFSIIETLPYDRPHTSMNRFPLCPECEREYNDPVNRRFHAQPNACPVCGPQMELWDGDGDKIDKGHEAILGAADAIRDGKIVAVKGIGGFHLMVDARNEKTVQRLRSRKRREEKPLALMAPNMETTVAYCEISFEESEWLKAPEAPIVLLKKHPSPSLPPLAESVAPGNPNLGIMLPYSPLHHILLHELNFPIVATSGNLSDEPICIDEQEAKNRLYGIADVFLVHNRPILRPVDDSVMRVVLGRELLLRRSRGFAPLPITYQQELPPILAVGAHLKNTIAINAGKNIFFSQHIGDLETPQAYEAFSEVIGSLQAMYAIEPEKIACDLHPDYISTKYAASLKKPVVPVQHHHAHIVSCMAEQGIQGPVLGVSWDGTGYGLDGTIWGGEFLLCTKSDFHRVAHLRPFPLPSGDQATKRPWRTALGLLYAMMGDAVFEKNDLLPVTHCPANEKSLLQRMLQKKINTPLVSSAGRLFDAVASIIGLRQTVSFEGQAAIELENGLDSSVKDVYPFHIQEPAKPEAPLILDWEPMIQSILSDSSCLQPQVSSLFHNTLIAMILSIAKRVGEPTIVLSGGCFQNQYLLENTVQQLKEEGFSPYWPLRVPPNDGGTALGQLVVAASRESA